MFEENIKSLRSLFEAEEKVLIAYLFGSYIMGDTTL